MRIVTVDDSILVQQIMAVTLGRVEGVELVGQAGDGAEALRVLATTKPDLAILDLVMPGMDGLSLVTAVRARHSEMKLLVISANLASEEHRKQVHDAGADYALDKPFSLQAFLKILKAMTHEPQANSSVS